MRLVIAHYHLLPGGVTDVIRDSVTSLLENRSDVTEVVLLSGRQENADSLIAAIRTATAGAELSGTVTDQSPVIRCESWEELDYADQQESASAAKKRAEVLVERFSTLLQENDVLWVHNYHVGKNAGLTRAVTELARQWNTPADPHLLLHIHDFPEDGRFANLAYLRKTLGSVPYPTGNHVRYAVINTRDLAVLSDAGIPGNQLFYLPNPVRTAGRERLPQQSQSARRDRLVMGLSAFAEEHGYRFHPDGPIVLYPVRAIRRKNVLEIATICRMMEHWNLVVTLPGTSSQEAAYSDLVGWAYADRRIHGCFGIGRNEHRYGFSFSELTAGADLVASSSVQEGFGLAYLNTLLDGVPLLARKLGTMGGLLPMFDGYPAHLYDRFVVPLTSPSITSMRGYLRLRYSERLDEIAESVPEERERLEQALDNLVSRDAIDFSFLPAQLQLTLLGDIRDDGFAADVRALNNDLLTAAESLVHSDPPDIRSRIDNDFGFAAFAERARRFTAADEPSTGSASELSEGIAQRVLSAYCGIDQARLLLGPLDHD